MGYEEKPQQIAAPQEHLIRKMEEMMKDPLQEVYKGLGRKPVTTKHIRTGATCAFATHLG